MARLLYSLRCVRILPTADILVTNTFWLPLLVRREDRGLVFTCTEHADQKGSALVRARRPL
jgi:hypothetical protein